MGPLSLLRFHLLLGSESRVGSGTRQLLPEDPVHWVPIPNFEFHFNRVVSTVLFDLFELCRGLFTRLRRIYERRVTRDSDLLPSVLPWSQPIRDQVDTSRVPSSCPQIHSGCTLPRGTLVVSERAPFMTERGSVIYIFTVSDSRPTDLRYSRCLSTGPDGLRGVRGPGLRYDVKGCHKTESGPWHKRHTVLPVGRTPWEPFLPTLTPPTGDYRTERDYDSTIEELS